MRQPGAFKKTLPLLALMLWLFSACGYRLVGDEGLSSLPGHIRTLAVPVFSNASGEPNLEKIVTQAVVNKLNSFGSPRIVNESGADAVLLGTVTGYASNIPISFQNRSRVQEFRVEIRADVVIKERGGEKVFWRRDNLFSRKEYNVADMVGTSKQNEAEAKRLAAEEFARNLAAVLTGF